MNIARRTEKSTAGSAGRCRRRWRSHERHAGRMKERYKAWPWRDMRRSGLLCLKKAGRGKSAALRDEPKPKHPHGPGLGGRSAGAHYTGFAISDVLDAGEGCPGHHIGLIHQPPHVASL